jgi:thiol-disulfide isomerase/thioredoxin
VEALTGSSFDKAIDEHKYILIDMYANWCSHCKDFEPEYNRLGKMLYEKQTDEVTIAAAKIDIALEDTDRYFLIFNNN